LIRQDIGKIAFAFTLLWTMGHLICLICLTWLVCRHLPSIFMAKGQNPLYGLSAHYLPTAWSTIQRSGGLGRRKSTSLQSMCPSILKHSNHHIIRHGTRLAIEISSGESSNYPLSRLHQLRCRLTHSANTSIRAEVLLDMDMVFIPSLVIVGLVMRLYYRSIVLLSKMTVKTGVLRCVLIPPCIHTIMTSLIY
jgi:hypothetical protein